MIYYVARRGLRTAMGIVLFGLSIWFIFSNLVFTGVHYFVFTFITLVLGINVTLDGIGINRLTISETEITLYRLPFFIKRVPLSTVVKLDYVEIETIFGTNVVVRMYYDSTRYIRISNYSTDSSLIKMKIEETISKM